MILIIQGDKIGVPGPMIGQEECMLEQILGNYIVKSQLGAGGMGVVYQATDTRLGRQVAIKMLHEASLNDPERLARFEREAQLLATLNHSNIAAIYGLEEAREIKFLVLEYVPGDTLAQLLAKARLPLKEVLNIGRQVADALAAAHEAGVVHRDLKPANIKITPEGKVKVLDFGLAKALEAARPGGTGAETMTISPEMTQAGVVMGTAAYMSPEQASGKPVDRGTDIWAFGCVMYEALTGKRTFPGDTTTELLVGILDREPDWHALPADIPENVKRLLRRCLEKDQHSRLHDIADARLELEETLSGKAVTEPATAVRKRAIWPAVAAGVVLGGAALGLWAWLQGRATPAPEVVRFTHQLPQGHRMIPTWNPSLMFSPDGKSLAFNYPVGGVPTAFQRPIDELEQKPLGGVKYLNTPVFSADGRWVVMVDSKDQILKKVAVGGGAPVPLTGVDMFGRGDWGRDGYIYFTERYPGSIWRIPENGGAKEPVTTLDPRKEEFVHKHAQILPGGKAIIFTVVSSGMESYNDARIEIQTLDTKQRKVLVQGGFCPRYSPSGHIVYANAGDLYAMPFDPKKMEVTGLPIKIVEGVQMSTNTGAAYFDISSTGALAYVPGIAEGGERTLVWVDRQGKTETLPLPARSYLFPRISPDAKTLAYEVEGATHNLYSYDFARGVVTKLTTDGLSHAPVWTPDGQNLCYRSWKAGTMTMWEMPADRSRPEERLTMTGGRQSAVSVSPDGRYLAYNQMASMGTGNQMAPKADRNQMAPTGAGSNMEPTGTESQTAPTSTGSDIWILPLQGDDRKPQLFVGGKFDEASPKFSPDGKWVAYCSNEAGKAEVYVQPWPGPGPKITLSSDGGTDPLWNRGGQEIFYRNADKMMVVPVSTAGGFKAGKPSLLWEGHYSQGMSSSCGPPGVSSASYDVTSDGRRFLMVKDIDQDASSTSIVVVLNWTEELKRLEQDLLK
jgi:serine/threonine-protein kinase